VGLLLWLRYTTNAGSKEQLLGYVTAIAWTDHTFNPWLGCHKVSQGCVHCYAETLVKNRMGMPGMWGAAGQRKRTKTPWQNVPRWNSEARAEGRAHRVFCASLADVFEDEAGPNLWRPEVWDLIHACPWLDFQLLTKRPENIERMLPDDWDEGWPNVWLGTSIEDNRVADRASFLTAVPAMIHFVSYEPAIGPLNELSLKDIEWVICGGESGPDYRPMRIEWAHDMRHRCAMEGIDFFFKQDAAPRTEMGIDALGEIVRETPLGWDRSWM